MKGFRDFILRGNVLDLAVAVVIGAAFTAIVTALVNDVINPLIGAIFQAQNLSRSLVITLPSTSGEPAKILLGAFIAAVINFLIIAAIVYFVFVLPANAMLKRVYARRQAAESATPADQPPTDVELLIQIRDLLARTPSAEGDHALPPTAPR